MDALVEIDSVVLVKKQKFTNGHQTKHFFFYLSIQLKWADKFFGIILVYGLQAIDFTLLSLCSYTYNYKYHKRTYWRIFTLSLK